MRGKILFVAAKGPWGFILPEFHEDGRPATGASDIFFHISGLPNKEQFAALQPGTLVEYAESRRGNKPCAVNVRILPKPTTADGVQS